MSVFDPKQSNDFAGPAPSFWGLLALGAAGLPPVLGLIYCLAASPGSPFGPGGPIGPAGPTGPGGPAGPRRSGRAGKAAIFYHHFSLILAGGDFDYASGRKLRSNPTKSTSRTALDLYCFVGAYFICTLGSRGRLTLPTIVNSPRVMAAVVISISARAFPPQVIAQAVVTATARIIFASMSSSVARNRRPLMGSEI